MEKAIKLYEKDHFYEDWLLVDLIALCKKRKLKCTRTKREIIECLVRDDTQFLNRLKEYRAKYGDDFSDKNVDEWVNRLEYDSMKVIDLKIECSKRDINISGKKCELCDNIRKYDLETIERMKTFIQRYM